MGLVGRQGGRRPRSARSCRPWRPTTSCCARTPRHAAATARSACAGEALWAAVERLRSERFATLGSPCRVWCW